MSLAIVSNNVPRPVLRWHDLTESERKDFDYIADKGEDATAEAGFGRYMGHVYDLNDMERGYGVSQMPAELAAWDNYVTDSFFSGIVIRYPRLGRNGLDTELDTDYVIFGRYYEKSDA